MEEDGADAGMPWGVLGLGGGGDCDGHARGHERPRANGLDPVDELGHGTR
jgi:hypothetical protein